MNRMAVLSLAIVLTIYSPAFAQKPPSAVVATKPALVCPQTDLGGADLNARYMATWERYAKTIEEAGKKVQEEIDKQTKSATSVGNLDLALFWKGLAKEFEQKGELRWDDATLKKTWNDRFGESSYPSQFAVTLKKASEAFSSATKDLENGYGELVSEFTKAEKLEEALKVRAELKELLAGSSPAPRPEPKPEPAPKPKPVPVPPIVGVWIGETGWGNEFREDKTARNLTPKGEVDTIGTWKEEGRGQYSARLGSWYWQIVLKGDEIEAVRYLNGQLKGHATLKRRR
jgi:hypothetical protein